MTRPQAVVPSGPERPRILLVAPNVSRRMGGEAAKSLQIFEGLRAMDMDVVQVTHARVRDEMRDYDPHLDIRYVEDGPVQRTLFRLRLGWALQFVGGWLLHRKARQVAAGFRPWIVHFTSPISPNVPYFRFDGTPVVIGPLNGNILHPPAFSHRESTVKRVGAWLLWPVQKLGGLLFKGKHHARLFISGGERTVTALEIGGCRRDQMVMTLDSGVDDRLADRPRLVHSGVNQRFVFLGRLVRYKGCDLALRALAQAPDAHLDIIGDGAERPALAALADRLGVADRVNFLGWIPAGEPLFDQLARYRAFIFPTLAEANGIVVQEAMMLGLPVVAVNWGGPAQLLTGGNGILIDPTGEDQVVAALADAMKDLGENGEMADGIAASARRAAESSGFAWRDLLRNWLHLYDSLLVKSHDGFVAWVERTSAAGVVRED